MVKYYDLKDERLVVYVKWKEGCGTLEQAKRYFKTDTREISLKEFNKLSKEYEN